MHRFGSLVLLLLCCCAAGCGDDEASACEQAGAQLCQKACECGADKSRCAIGQQGTGGVSTISFKDLKGCTDLYVVLGCAGGGSTDIDHAACLAAMGSASCTTTASGGAVLLPQACQPKQ